MTGTPASSRGGGLPLGLTGATAATRYVGATASGAPGSGTFAQGDFIVDQTGLMWVCTVAGSPGTWVQVGGSAGAMTLLTTVTNGSAATFDVSGISGSYNDLRLVCIMRGADAGTNDNATLVLNNDTAAHYNQERTIVTGATASGQEVLSGSNFTLGQITAGGSTANYFTAIIVDLLGYASTTWNKIAHWRLGTNLNDLTGNQEIYTSEGIWRSTAAITRVTIKGISTANLATGSQLRIYGIL